jgi:hypothetical protein
VWWRLHLIVVVLLNFELSETRLWPLILLGDLLPGEGMSEEGRRGGGC